MAIETNAAQSPSVCLASAGGVRLGGCVVVAWGALAVFLWGRSLNVIWMDTGIDRTYP